ncbi:MAG: redoxin family protein, partial [Candidatus Zixiibacteriota bacterium]
IAVAAIALAAYIAGHSLGNYFSNKKTSQFLAERDRRTQSVLQSHIQLAVGNTLPEHAFETLEFDTVRLSTCLSENTILVAVHPDCQTCVDEMAAISRMQAENDRIGPFVFISSANPRILAELRDSLQLGNCFLYDHRKRFLSRFGIDTYPLFVTVDSNRRIKDIVLGSLLLEEIEEALDK